MNTNEKRAVRFQTESEILAEFEAGETELARQLLGLRQAPSAALQQRIQAIPQPAAAQTREAAAPADPRPERGLVTRPFPVQPRLRTVLAGTLILAILLAGMIAAYPPTRASAQGALENLLAYFGFSRQEPAGPAPIVTQRRIDPSTITRQPPTPTPTRGEIEALAGFDVKAPVYLPDRYQEAGFRFDTGVNRVFWMAWIPTSDAICRSPITLWQFPASEESKYPRRIGDAPAVPVTVAGSPGLWIEELDRRDCTVYNADDSVQRVESKAESILTWEQGGIRYRLATDSTLGLDEMLRIAESLE